MTVEAWAQTHIGLVRKSNQDSVGCFNALGLFVVADGMGGHADGEVASRMAVELIRDYIQHNAYRGPLRRSASRLLALLRHVFAGSTHAPGEVTQAEALPVAVRLANHCIFELGQKSVAEGEERPLGTTVVALRLARERAYWAHVGDSRLYRTRAGSLRLLTADHTVYGEAYLGQTDVPLNLPHTNKLLHALGIQADLNVSSASDTAMPDDIYLLCSDGVHALVPAPVIREQLMAPRPLAETGEHLIQVALDGGGKDNISVVLVRVGGQTIQRVLKP